MGSNLETHYEVMDRRNNQLTELQMAWASRLIPPYEIAFVGDRAAVNGGGPSFGEPCSFTVQTIAGQLILSMSGFL